MSNISEVNQELVRAFNISLCYNSIVITNLTVQNLHGKDHIVISFDNNMDSRQCMKYLNNMKEKIIKRSYRNEKVAGVSYNLKFFPFAFNARHLPRDDKGRKKFSVEIDEGVVFNLKCYLAQALVGDVIEKMGSKFGVERIKKSIYDTKFNRNSYLYCMFFHDKELQKDFVDLFSAQIRRYGNAPIDYLEENGDLVYIKKSIFDDVEFIKDIEAYNASLICRHFQTPNTKSKAVDKLKYTIVNFMDKVANIPIRTVIRTSYKGSGENSVLIPIVTKNMKDNRLFDDNDVHKANKIFGIEILSDVGGDISMKLPKSDNSDSTVYGIDFSDLDISHCVITKIIESSVINQEHELSIDPELHFRALSPEPPRTPPEQTGDKFFGSKGNRDSGIGESPPKPKDSGSSSGGPGSLFEQSQVQGFPTWSQDEALKDSPRRGSEKSLLHNSVNLAGTSKGSWSSTQLSFPTVSQGVPGPSKGGNLGAVAASGSIPGSSLWSQSGASSSKGANPVGTNPWAQQTNPCLSQGTSENKWISSMQFTKPGPSGLSWSQSGASSSRGAGKNMLTGSSSWFVPPSTSSLTTRNDPISSNLGIFADPPEDTENICSMKEKQQVTKEKEEEKLSKALLYTFNLMNYTLDGVYTNFFAKDGKIVSLLHDNVDREEYLQVVIDYVVEEYYETEKEARESCDFDEFPFKFLPDPDYEKNQNDCEKNSRKTVVANISSGALSNLEKLFRQKFGKNVGAIDINWVKKVEKREKDEWVDRQRSYGDSLEEACKGCFPDEGPMKIIPIALEGDEYVLDRSREECEVKLLLREQKLRLRGTLVNEEEKELFKALLYAFNYSNNNFDLPDTNFIVKNGKIASLIPDSVNVEEYLQEVIDKTKEEYCEDKKEAYDLDEFPFELNCEKNQETTVVANISRGALFNLKKLFIYGYKKKAETGDIDIKIGDIDINTVEEAVKSKKDELVNSKVKGIEREGGYYSRIKPDEAATASYPDGNALEGIPIIKGKGGYCLDRTFNDWETKLFVEDSEYTKGTSKAKKMKSEDNKDSGISSGEATDAENVSSKAEGKTSGTSGYESMDCENTRGGSPKHTLELSVENLIISTKLDATKAEQHSPIKKFRSN